MVAKQIKAVDALASFTHPKKHSQCMAINIPKAYTLN
jgi:hypothetical protein